MEARTARRVGLGLCCALALALQVRFVREQIRAGREPSQDQIGEWLAAVGRLPTPPETATIGFVTTIDSDQWEARLFLTRYALAPRLVLQGSGAPWIVGHLRSRAEANEVARAAGLSILVGFDDGLFLLGSPTP